MRERRPDERHLRALAHVWDLALDGAIEHLGGLGLFALVLVALSIEPLPLGVAFGRRHIGVEAVAPLGRERAV